MKYKNKLEGKSNIYLTGDAGAGKTYEVNDYISKHPDTTLLCASTGTAAVNIGGVTAHKLFSIPVPAAGGNPSKVTPSKLTAFANVDTVIVDEISMLRNDAFSFMVKVLKKAEKLYGKKIRLIVVGDFSQLPPIVTKKDEALLQRYGFDKSGFAFTAKEWAECKFKVVELTEIKRQTDTEFIENIRKARRGDTSCISYFNSFVGDPANAENAVYICGTNAEADRINTEYLNSIDKPVTAYIAEKSGIIGKDLPCDEIVLIKEGARVMFTANDSVLDADGKFNAQYGESGRYTNGMLGEVIAVNTDKVTVKTERGDIIEVEKHKWSIYNYRTDRTTMTLNKTEIGWIKQIPLKIAKGMTIHKSQGKTFSHVIFSPQIFTAGQLYVALSRVRGPEGLVLTEPILPEYLQNHKVVQKFYENGYTYEISEAQKRKQTEVEKKQASNTKKATKKKTIKKKTSTKKTASKKATTKKTAAKKTTAKKTTRKSTTRKTITRRAAAKRSSAKSSKK